MQEESPLAADDLQNVLTRYVDSHDGYLQASEAVDSPDLATAFRDIAARRKAIVHHVAAMILREGERPDLQGSTEAAVHRWWLRVRAAMTTEELKAVLAECLRGETVLAQTIQDALAHGELTPDQTQALGQVADELKQTIRTFEVALEH